jgi:hypothetical protein
LRMIRPPRENFSSRKTELMPIAAIPPRQEGRSANRHQTRDGMRWTLLVLPDERHQSGRPSRVVLSPRRWGQVFRATFRGKAIVATKPGTPGEHGAPLTPLRRGCRMFRRICGDCPLLSLLRAGHGCDVHPAFPAPS